MSLPIVNLFKALSVLALIVFSATSVSVQGQTTQADSQPTPTASVLPEQQATAEADEAAPTDSVEEPKEVFLLPTAKHPWAKFKPGAWREIKIVTTTYSKSGKITKSTTTQKEILETVAEDKYVLNIQATIDTVGKRIIGGWKKRILNIATDHAGQVVDSSRSSFAYEAESRLAGCQVWEVSYSDGTQSRRDRICYDPERYPYILRRETYGDQREAETTAGAERVVEVTARSVGYQFGEQLLECSFIRTDQHLAKGDTERMAFVSPKIPGGLVYSWATDFDTEGEKVRGSTTEVVAFGLTAPEPSTQP